jgi:medium-chain acyl-[acyl-carrier-protein] hydrolase
MNFRSDIDTAYQPRTVERNRWAVRLRPKQRPLLRLFCFPYSGAGASAFNAWHAAFPEEIEIVAVEYPGHGQRLAEPLSREMNLLVDAASEGLLPLLDLPFAFFGHSLGALVAFEVARTLSKRAGLLPAALFLSGHSAPHIQPREESIANLPDDELVQRICQLNGTADHLLDLPEMRELFLPIFRADFSMCDAYTCRAEDPLLCPIFVCGGVSDPYVPMEDLAQWYNHAARHFECRLFPGDHFYLHASRPALLSYVIQQVLASLSTARGSSSQGTASRETAWSSL